MTFAAAIDRVNRACESTFGEAATLNGTPLVGIYQAPYVAAFGLASVDPTFRTRTTQAAPVATSHGATLVCAAGTFKVRSAQPDGTGWSTLTLEKP
jgi:hypothetical protein